MGGAKETGRIGPARLGTLRFIDESVVAAAAQLVRYGIVVPLNSSLSSSPAHPGRPRLRHELLEHQALRLMSDGRYGVVNDDVVAFALQSSTHWDAIAHFGVLEPEGTGVYFNGASLDTTSEAGPAKSLGIESMAQGLVTRGVLIDAVGGLEGDTALYVDPERVISRQDIEDCLYRQHVRLRSGDVVLLYTGYENYVVEAGGHPSRVAGIDASTIELWRAAETSALAADSPGVEKLPPTFEVHAGLLRDLGMPLGELWALTELCGLARQLDAWEFLLVSVPLNLPGAFGSPANAVAVL